MLSVELGAPRREEMPHKLETAYGVAVYANDQSNSFARVREETCTHRAYRMHVPVRIICRAAKAPRMATLCYAFAYQSRQDDLRPSLRALTNLAAATLRVADIPLQAGITEWTLTSDWLVELDQRLWAESDGYIEETRGGQQRRRRTDSDRSRALSGYFLPYRLALWVPQPGLDGAWPEYEFPHLVIREVQGNEVVAGVAVYVFTDDPALSGGGTTDNKAIERLVQQYLPRMENPQRPAPVFTNTWETRAWAGAVARAGTPQLRAAVLARITREQPDDRDAADLLLRTLGQDDDASRAFRVYQQNAARFGDLSEHWFQQYYRAVTNPAARRAALAVYRRAHPESVWALEQQVIEMVADEQWDLARRLTAEWMTREPSNAAVYLHAARIAEQQESPDDARRHLTTALALVLPLDATVTGVYRRGSAAHRAYLCGANALRMGDGELARAHWRQAVAQDASYYPAMLAQATLYLSNAVASPAVRELDVALQHAPEHPAALQMLARVQARRHASSAGIVARLRAVLQPRIDAAMARQDWTNVATLARYLLDVAPADTATRLLYARALLRVQQYEDASAALQAIALREQGSAAVRAAWAELCGAMDEDQAVLVVAEHPVEWRRRQIEAWQGVARAAPRDARAVLELALLYRQEGKRDEFIAAVQKLYGLQPSPELAQWLGDISLRQASEEPGATMPQQPGRTYLTDAREWYQKTGVTREAGPRTRIEFGMPAAYVGYARSATLRAGTQDDPMTFLRAGLRRFPDAPDVRAAMIAGALRHDLVAPLLWQPYTNQLVALFDMREDVAAAMAALAKQVGTPAEYADALARQAAVLARCHAALFREPLSRMEYRRPAQVYVLNHDARTSFAARRLAFLTPAEAYDWYAIRSRYAAADLLNGTTRWWRRRSVLERGLDLLNEAGRLLGNPTNATYASAVLGSVYQPLMGQYQLYETMSPAAAYVTELHDCFGRTRERAVRARRPMALRPQAGGQFVIGQLPPLVTSEAALPAEACPWFVPPGVLYNVLWRSDPVRATPWWDGAAWRVVPVSQIVLPDAAWQFSAGGGTRTPGLVTGMVARGGISFAQRAPGSPADTNRAAVALLQASEARVPMLPAFFNGTLTGAVCGMDLRAVQFDGQQPPRVALVFSPVPLTQDVRTSGEEALTLLWQWTSLTTTLCRVYTRSAGVEHSLQPGEFGVPLGELHVPDDSDFMWRIDRGSVTVWCGSNETARVSGAHGLSAYAWPRGVYLATQVIISPTPFSVQARGLMCGQ